MKKLLFVFLILNFNFSYSQKTTRLNLKNFEIGRLSSQLKESSGLDFYNGHLFTFNDSGNTAEIFEISPKNGKILDTIKTNLVNKDWEALANDGKNIYIGDFGNNAGTRRDLKIYKITLNSNFKADSVSSYSFFYPQQQDFTPKNLNTDFDAEALIFLNNQLHIFSKEWESKKTTHYIIELSHSEEQAVHNVEEFQTGFVVTDAAFYNDKLYFVGYTKWGRIYLDIFKMTSDFHFFQNKPRRFYLGSAFKLSQIEGIAVNETGVYFSGEDFHSPLGIKKATFYFVPFDKFQVD